MKLHDFAASTLVPMFVLSFFIIMFEANAKEAEVSFKLKERLNKTQMDEYKSSLHQQESKEHLEVQDQNLILEMLKSKGLIEEDLTENLVSVVI